MILNQLKRGLSLLALSGFFVFLASCESDDDSTNEPAGPDVETLKTEAVEQYANVVYQSYVDSHQKAVELQQVLSTFTANSTEANFALAKNAWLACRAPYGQTEVYRFYNGPIDAEPGGPEGDLNSWPLNEAFIDYVEGAPMSGIVNDPSVPITEEYLRSNNAQDVDEVNVTIGYHAIEFLLWGQDNEDPSALIAGDRPLTDFTTADNADRRKEYLNICAQMTVDDLQGLLDVWQPGGSYRTEFTADADQALTNILTGMGSLSKAELAGERMNVALVNNDQEDEHSCFSDNTHIDIQMNALGIQNVYLGTYIASGGTVYSGTGLYDVVAATNPTLADELKEDLEASVSLSYSIQAPFDFEISSSNPRGNQRVQAAIGALQSQTTTIERAAQELGLSINTDG